MASARLLVAVSLLALLLGGAGALAWWSHASTPGESGSYEVEIVGPDGILFSGAVAVENATALSALQAAAARAGLAVQLEEYPGMGTYVRAIGPHRASGPTGWVYEVREPSGWTYGDRSAADRPLTAGEAVRWSWTEG